MTLSPFGAASQNVAMTDLVQRLADGGEEAAQEFESTFKRRLVRCAESNGIPVDYSRDLAQDVLFGAILQIREGKFRGEAELGTSLRRILLNKIADFWRDAERHARLLECAHPDHWSVRQQNASSTIQAHPTMDQRLDLERLMNGLPSLQRAILLMHESEGWTIEEIAEKLAMPAGTVGRKLKEAKDMLRQRVRFFRETAALRFQASPLKKLGAGND